MNHNLNQTYQVYQVSYYHEHGLSADLGTTGYRVRMLFCPRFTLVSRKVACESIRFSFALRRWGRFAKRPQRRRAKEKRMLSQATRKEVRASEGSRNENSLPLPLRVNAYGRRTSTGVGPVLF